MKAPRGRPLIKIFTGMFAPASEIFGNFLELIDGLALFLRQRTDSLFKAMIEMILDQCTLCLTDGFLDSMELLGDIKARPIVFDHFDDAAQMTIGAFQPFGNVGMMLVNMMFLRRSCLICHCCLQEHGQSLPVPLDTRQQHKRVASGIDQFQFLVEMGAEVPFADIVITDRLPKPDGGRCIA
jgi:hypothetical protein